MAYSCAVRKETIRESYYLFKFIYYYVESSHLRINENILFHIDPIWDAEDSNCKERTRNW
jgi:hypothetical protein